MDWIETVGDTIEDAKDTALDRLGVAIDDVEFEVVDDAETGWFGRVKTKARVRARVKPNKPREKQDDRGARRGRGRGRGQERTKSSGSKQQNKKSTKSEPTGKDSNSRRSAGSSERSDRNQQQKAPKAPKSSSKTESKTAAKAERGDTVREDLSVDEQAEVAKAFMTDLLNAFEIDGTVEISTVDEETREISADGGEGIGLLIGPKGKTIDAIQELVRTTVQRRSAPGSGRVKVDIAGYRQRRKEALVRFVNGVAEEVIAENEERALEPMNAADRKVVHDAVADLDGVETRSDGEDPRRRVVLCPSD